MSHTVSRSGESYAGNRKSPGASDVTPIDPWRKAEILELSTSVRMLAETADPALDEAQRVVARYFLAIILKENPHKTPISLPYTVDAG